MMLPELLQALDALGWEEFYEVRSRDEHPERSSVDEPSSSSRLKSIAGAMEPELLTQLEHTPGYLVWALRLCPYVHGANCAARAREHSASEDYAVRYWAQKLLEARP